ncbi:hypothetical protein Tco_0437741 [Tanacetum coccineum]
MVGSVVISSLDPKSKGDEENISRSTVEEIRSVAALATATLPLYRTRRPMIQRSTPPKPPRDDQPTKAITNTLLPPISYLRSVHPFYTIRNAIPQTPTPPPLPQHLYPGHATLEISLATYTNIARISKCIRTGYP